VSIAAVIIHIFRLNLDGERIERNIGTLEASYLLREDKRVKSF
jgi:hypothetical protein